MPAMLRFIVVVAAFLLFSTGGAQSSEGFDDIVTLVKAGATEDVLLAFVEKSAVYYRLTADEITLLDDLGATQKVIDAIQKHNDGGDAQAAPDVVEAPNDPDAEIQPVAVAPASDDQNIS